MNKFFRWYYQNKNKFWVIVLIIVGSYGLILWFNNYAKSNREPKKTTINYANSNTIISEESALSQKNIDSQKLKEANNLIDKFITYCNNGDVISAYSMLSDKCKKEKFLRLEDFIDNYYAKIFETNKIYEMQNWKDSIYQVKLRNNPMSTGKIESDEFLQDFYIIEYENGKALLNINNEY